MRPVVERARAPRRSRTRSRSARSPSSASQTIPNSRSSLEARARSSSCSAPRRCAAGRARSAARRCRAGRAGSRGRARRIGKCTRASWRTRRRLAPMHRRRLQCRDVVDRDRLVPARPARARPSRRSRGAAPTHDRVVPRVRARRRLLRGPLRVGDRARVHARLPARARRARCASAARGLVVRHGAPEASCRALARRRRRGGGATWRATSSPFALAATGA